MIDIHSHILPEIDDGSKNIEMTINMLKIAQNEGTKKIFATPHYYRGYFETTYDEVKSSVNEINKIAMQNNIDIEILEGQEIFLDNHLIENYKSGIIGTLYGTDYMLIEFSFDILPREALDIIYELNILGTGVIIAHPERYKYIIEKNSNINAFVDEGCLFQVNSGSLTGIFGNKVKKTAQNLIKSGAIHFIASDAHTDGIRAPRLKEAMNIVKKINMESYGYITCNLDKIYQNQKINNLKLKIKEKKSIMDIFIK